MSPLSAGVVAEDLRALAEVVPFDTATIEVLLRAADLLEERVDPAELDRLRHLEAACLDVSRKFATHELRGYALIATGVWAPIRAALSDAPPHPSCVNLDEVPA